MPEHITTISIIVMIGGMIAALIAIYVGLQNRALMSSLETKLAGQETLFFKRAEAEFVHQTSLVAVLHSELAEMENRFFKRAGSEFVNKEICVLRENTMAASMLAYTTDLKTRHLELYAQVARIQDQMSALSANVNSFISRNEKSN